MLISFISSWLRLTVMYCWKGSLPTILLHSSPLLRTLLTASVSLFSPFLPTRLFSTALSLGLGACVLWFAILLLLRPGKDCAMDKTKALFIVKTWYKLISTPLCGSKTGTDRCLRLGAVRLIVRQVGAGQVSDGGVCDVKADR